MYDLSLGQIITASSFVGILICIQLYIRKNKSKLKNHWSLNRRINLIETLKLNAHEKIQILRIDKAEYLYIFTKGTQPVVLPLEEKSKSSRSEIEKKSSKLENVRFKSETQKQKEIVSQKTLGGKAPNKMLEAISDARKLNPKVSFK